MKILLLKNDMIWGRPGGDCGWFSTASLGECAPGQRPGEQQRNDRADVSTDLNVGAGRGPDAPRPCYWRVVEVGKVCFYIQNQDSKSRFKIKIQNQDSSVENEGSTL